MSARHWVEKKTSQMEGYIFNWRNRVDNRRFGCVGWDPGSVQCYGDSQDPYNAKVRSRIRTMLWWDPGYVQCYGESQQDTYNAIVRASRIRTMLWWDPRYVQCYGEIQDTYNAMVRSKIRTMLWWDPRSVQCYGEIQDPYNAIWFHKPNVRHKKYQMTQWTQMVPKNASTWNATFLSFNVFK